MPGILPTEVQWYLSAPNASGGYTQSGSPGNSLGKYISFSQVQSGSMDDLFLDITQQQNAADQVDYQCLFLMNNTASSNNIYVGFLWMPTAFWTYNGAQLLFGFDPIGVTSYLSTSPQAQSIANSLTAPTGVTYLAGPQNQPQQGTAIPAIPPQHCIAIWIQRQALNTPNVNPQTAMINCTYQTSA